MRKTLAFFACIVLAQVSTTAFANSYFIAGVGSTNITSDQTDFDSDSTSFRIGIGAPLDNRNLFVEGYYIDYGTATDFGIDVFGTAIAGQILVKSNTNVSTSIFGKLGLASWDGEAAGISESGTDIYYGVGVESMMDAKSSIRLEIETISFDVTNDTVYATTVGLRFVHKLN